MKLQHLIDIRQTGFLPVSKTYPWRSEEGANTAFNHSIVLPVVVRKLVLGHMIVISREVS